MLLEKIKEKDRESSFAEFLSHAYWIHISSLCKYSMFEEIMEYVMEAKRLNRFLKISIDPGYEYTSAHRDELKKYLSVADFVFLSRNEYENLIINQDMPANERYIKLAEYFDASAEGSTKVFVIKYKNRHELIDIVNGVPYVYYHRKIPTFRICNDTGAGDCFAGGFIAGMLSNRLLAQQPAVVELGALTAKVRMTTSDSRDVSARITEEAEQFFRKNYRNGRDGWKKRACFWAKSHLWNAIWFLIGFIILPLLINAISSVLF